MKEDSMTLPEGRTIFEFLEVSGGVASVKDVSKYLTDAGMRSFNYRSVRRTTLFYRNVLKREMLKEPIEPTKEITSALAGLIGYGTTEDWVALRLNWYSQWRRDRAERDRLDKARLERLLDHMWVPSFADLAPFMLRGDGKLHAAELAGKPFKWLEAKKKAGQKTRVIRCWLSDEEDQWLRRTVTASVFEADKARLITSYDQIQRDVSVYFQSAARQRTSEEIGAELTVRDVHEAFLGGSNSTHHPRFAELLGIALDPQDLRGSIISFSDEVRFVVGL